ncbi:MAG: polysaccharide biosynthesis/export family protein [Cyanobacteria bacterium P01_F01_bin.153]
MSQSSVNFAKFAPHKFWRSRSLTLQLATLAAVIGSLGGASAGVAAARVGALSGQGTLEPSPISSYAQLEEESQGTEQGAEPIFPDIPRQPADAPQPPQSEPLEQGDPALEAAPDNSPEASDNTAPPPGDSSEESPPSPAAKQPKPDAPSADVAGEEGDRNLEDAPDATPNTNAPRRLPPLLPRRDSPTARPERLFPLPPGAEAPGDRFERDPNELGGDDPLPNVPPALLEPVDPWRAYRLSPLDSIVVQVFGYPDLSFNTNVDQGGRILVPLVGFLKVEGLTLEALQDALESAYNEYVVDPEVLVTLGSQVNPDIVVSGEVVRPGFYRVGSFETVVQALISAGGVKDSADLRAITLRRRLPDGTLLEQELNLLELLAEGLPEPRLFLQDGDVVFVPRREVVNDPTYNFALATLNNLGQPTIRVRLLAYVGEGGLRTVTLPTGSSFIDVLEGLPISQINLRKVALIRFEAEQGTVVTQELDGKAAILGDLTQNPQLRDNDVIVVNRNLITKLTVFFNRFTQPFRDVLGFLLFFRELDSAAEELFGPEGTFNGGSDNDNNDNDN